MVQSRRNILEVQENAKENKVEALGTVFAVVL